MKLHGFQQTEVRYKYATGKFTLNELAELYGCRLIDIAEAIKPTPYEAIDFQCESEMDNAPTPDDYIIGHYNRHGAKSPPSFEERLRVLPSKKVSLFKQLNQTT